MGVLPPVRIVLGQVNLLVGDVSGNVARLLAVSRQARDELGAHAVLFPELALSGYPPEDLLLRPGFLTHVERGLDRLRRGVEGIDVIVGFPWRRDERVYNAAALLRDGKIVARYRKQCLPNYGVFDEKRYFTPGAEPCIVDIAGIPTGITICEDAWEPGPMAQAAAAGAKLILNLNASPFNLNKQREREEIVAQRVRENRVPVLYTNLVGGQDELVFDGGSFAMGADARIVRRAPAFAEAMPGVDCDPTSGAPVAGDMAPVPGDVECIYRAIVLGVRDYVDKNRFPGVVIGLSGGIDSALTLAIAVDALGADRVEAVSMPSRYTASMSVEDAREQAEVLGARFRKIPIDPIFETFLDGLREEFAGLPPDVTEENIQARIRGTLLMAISNKTGKMVLTTGNKSEMAVGYATLYGDMVGGFGAIKDVPKTLVYRLAEYRNAIADVIPRRVIERPPSAELAPDQTDQDLLPPYPVLDAILEHYIERDECIADIVAHGFEEGVVRQVAQMVNRNEYKRRQAAPGVRISRRAFGRDRRYPITSGYGASIVAERADKEN